MGTLLDGQFGMKVESTFGTAVVVDRFYEILADSTHNFSANPIQGQGLRVGGVHPRSARRVAGVGSGEVTVKAEVMSKGFGVLLGSVCGAYAHTLDASATYQGRGLSDVTGTRRSSYTLQFGVPRSDASGTVDPYTYAGCVPTSFEIDAPERGIPTISVTFWAASVTTATALASASYATTPTLFADSAGAAGTTLGGTITVPTATAVESGGTASTTIRSWRLSGDLMPNERPRLGGWQQPTTGGGNTTLTVVQDYEALTLQAIQASQAATSFTGYFTGAALGTGTERFGVVVPEMKVDDGAFGQLTGGEGSVPEISFTVLDDGTKEPWYLVYRTADAAI